jgi:hypothetical protein
MGIAGWLRVSGTVVAGVRVGGVKGVVATGNGVRGFEFWEVFSCGVVGKALGDVIGFGFGLEKGTGFADCDRFVVGC